jgi:cytochrome c biogenesis protein
MRTATRWLRSLGRMLCSSRLAVALLAALLLASIFASLFPQRPDAGSMGLDATTADSIPWLETMSLRYGSATGLLQTLGLFDAFRSLPFLLLLAALSLNLLLCTVQRLAGLWRSLVLEPTVVRPEAFYQSLACRAEWPVPSVQTGLAAAQQVLAHSRFSIYIEHDRSTPCTHIYAERGRWAQIARPVSHAAALLLLILVLARPLLSWQEPAVLLLPGQVYEVAHKPGLFVQAGDSVVVQSTDQRALEHQVPLTILVENSPALTRTVSLNHPLAFRGIAFHLQGDGPAARVTTPDASADLAFKDVRTHEITLSEAGPTLRVAYQPDGDTLFVEAVAQDGSLLGSGSVANGEELYIQGTPIAFTLSHYTLWQISHDPTFGPAIGLAGLLLLATLVSLSVSHRRIWLRVGEHKAQGVATPTTFGSDALLAAIAEGASGIRRALPAPGEEAHG